ncbi:MAG: gamma carbonic anhydrase family protein [Fusobacteriaceae bacterium]|nr:gamma carbonic anhydrase family protein [Fusobacteriaceae bacterium]
MLYQVRGKSPRLGKNNIVLPGASVIGDVTTGKNVSIWFHTVVRGDAAPIVIGDNSNVQDNSVVHVEKGKGVAIGNNVTIGHNCVIHGCSIGDNCLIGMGAIILSDSVIPENCLVAAGAVVGPKLNAAAGSLIAGNPAKVLKTMEESHMKLLKYANDEYLERLEYYQEELQLAEKQGSQIP